MDYSLRYTEWFKMAKIDFDSAEILYNHEGENEIICFHLHQATEKYLKGYLMFKEGVLQDGHNLRKLCIKAKQYNSKFNDFVKDCAFLNDFYIETRYPAENPLIVENDDVQECFEIVERILKFIDSQISNTEITEVKLGSNIDRRCGKRTLEKLNIDEKVPFIKQVYRKRCNV